MDAEAPEAWAALVQYLVRTGQPAKAEAVIAQARTRLPLAKAQVVLPYCQTLVASLLEHLGQADAADEILKRYVAESGQPAAVLLRAEFLGRQQRLGEALALCEEAWKTCPADQVANVCVALLHTEPASATDYLRVTQWLKAALAKTPESTPLCLAQAETLNLQGNYPEASRLYRRVLTTDDRNLSALNNLAWLLAQQESKADEALALVNRAIDLHGPVAPLLDTRAVVYLKMGDERAALRDAKAATAQQPTAAHFLHLAQACLLANDRDAAGKALQKAKAANLTPQSLHPLERNAYYQLLEILP